jgi:hypothetical protein
VSIKEKRFLNEIFLFSVAGLPVNDKVKTLEHDYMKAKDEILTLLRERGDVIFIL